MVIIAFGSRFTQPLGHCAIKYVCGNDLILAALSFLIFLSGIVLDVKSLFHPLESHQAYNDVYYWGVPDENDGGDDDVAAGDEIIEEKAKEYQMNTFSDLSATEALP